MDLVLSVLSAYEALFVCGGLILLILMMIAMHYRVGSLRRRIESVDHRVMEYQSNTADKEEQMRRQREEQQRDEREWRKQREEDQQSHLINAVLEEIFP